MSVGPGEILLIALVVLILFGARRLPEIGRSIGAGVRDFKRAVDGSQSRRDRQVERDDSHEVDHHEPR